jgi:hypothetical protein
LFDFDVQFLRRIGRRRDLDGQQRRARQVFVGFRVLASSTTATSGCRTTSGAGKNPVSEKTVNPFPCSTRVKRIGQR